MSYWAAVPPLLVLLLLLLLVVVFAVLILPLHPPRAPSGWPRSSETPNSRLTVTRATRCHATALLA